MLIAVYIVKRRLKMPRENISGQVRNTIKLEGEVPYPNIQILLVMTTTLLRGLQSEGKDQMGRGHIPKPIPHIKYSSGYPVKHSLRNKVLKSFTDLRIAELY